MKCPFSGKPCLLPKDIHVTEVKDGETVKLHLCHECGLKYLNMPNTEVKNTTSQVRALPTGEIAAEVFSNDQLTSPCPKCGTTAAEILQNQKVGCDVCYTFHPSLQSAVKASQRILPGQPAKHTGKRPGQFKIKDQIKKLEAKMAEAIKVENYEKASVLRDAIKELKGQLDLLDGSLGQE
jgi:protein arginine kinase activator